MNNWNQNQNYNFNTPNYNPYNWQQRLPVYTAAPIHGEHAAWQFPMGPNSEIYLPDDEQDIIWWIRTDNVGNRTVMPFDINPHKDPEPLDMNDILTRLSALEEKINAKQNKSNAKRAAAAVADTTIPASIE